MSESFLKTIEARRTYYALSKESTVPDSKIEEICAQVIKHTPSSFNSQTTRIVILFGAEHDKLWDETAGVLKAVVPEDKWEYTNTRIQGFKSGYATILFFDDEPSVKGMQEAFPLYKENFPGWAAESNAMHQFLIWTALELEGLGANLQHYHPLINQKLQSEFNVPVDWAPRAQMVIGKPVGPPGIPGMEKTFKPIEGERLIVKRS